MTAQDHLDRGSTPPKYLTDNPGKKWHELLDNEQLRNVIADQVMVVTAQHRKALGGSRRDAQILEIVLTGFLEPNIAYLKEIGRIPAELEDFDPVEAFALPEPTGRYFVTGQANGECAVGLNQGGSWSKSRDEVRYDWTVNAEGVLKCIDSAQLFDVINVRVHHAVVGRELTGDEIRSLRREQVPATKAG